MVILRLLLFIRKQKLLPVQTLIAVHIDYGNRPEAHDEAAFLASYCERHDVVFEVRVITEVSRGVTDRDTYERRARELRYSFYQQVLARHGGHGVIFGHHLGDVQENVISNVMR